MILGEYSPFVHNISFVCNIGVLCNVILIDSNEGAHDNLIHPEGECE